MRLPAILCLLVASATLTPAATVSIDYALASGTAAIEPFTLTDPTSGAEFTVSPSLTIDSGSFVAVFPSDAAGIVGDGDALISNFSFFGSLDIAIATVIVFPVTANLTGPLSGAQMTDSTGTLADVSTYLETGVGNYDTVAGPLDCTDSAFGFVCTALETALGVTFPITQVGGDDAPLPFTGGTFSDLNGTLPSTAGNTIDFSIPIDATNNFGVGIDFSWLETERTLLIPEPGSAVLLATAAGIALLRRRR